MFDDYETDIKEYNNWVAPLSKDNTQRGFLFFSLNRVVRALAYKDINYHKVTADWTFYL